MSHSTQNSHFGDVLPSQSLGVVPMKLTLHNKSKQRKNKTVQAKPEKHTYAKFEKCTKIKPKHNPTLIFKHCSCVCVSLCTTVIHNTAQNSSDDFLSYPPDNHHSSDDVYYRVSE